MIGHKDMELSKAKVHRATISNGSILGLFGGGIETGWKVQLKGELRGWFEDWNEAVAYATKLAAVTQLAESRILMDRADEFAKRLKEKERG